MFMNLHSRPQRTSRGPNLSHEHGPELARPIGNLGFSVSHMCFGDRTLSLRWLFLSCNPLQDHSPFAKSHMICLMCLNYTHVERVPPIYTFGKVYWHRYLGGGGMGVHSIVKLNTTCNKIKSTFYIKHHQNESKVYQILFMNRYTWYLLHRTKRYPNLMICVVYKTYRF